MAHAAAVVDQCVVGPDPVAARDASAQVALGRLGRPPTAQAEPVRHPEHMGVDRERRDAEGGGEDDARGLAADAGQRLERLPPRRHAPPVAVDQDLGQGLQVPRLGAVQT